MYEDIHDMYSGLHDAYYISQRYSWDCGIACSTMVLKWSNLVTLPNKSISNRNLVDETPYQYDWETPLWTIDLYCFLRERGVDAEMTTSYKGINQTHKDIQWYQKHMNIDEHAELVEQKFHRAEAMKWNIGNSTSTYKLSEVFVSSQVPNCEEEIVAILLVNMLYIENPEHEDPETQYSGHYILIIHFDAKRDQFSYLDPAKNGNVRRVSSKTLDLARSSRGTDVDLIIAKKRNNV
jgi:hypothetical protein